MTKQQAVGNSTKTARIAWWISPPTWRPRPWPRYPIENWTPLR